MNYLREKEVERLRVKAAGVKEDVGIVQSLAASRADQLQRFIKCMDETMYVCGKVAP
jgi:hypothetical protein